MSWTSRDDHLVHPSNLAGVQLVRATGDAADAVTGFLLEQDVRPAPREADVAALLGRSDAALFYAVRDSEIVGVACCVRDGSLARFVHFVIRAGDQADALAASLVRFIEAQARADGASVLAAETTLESPAYRCLRGCGFAVDSKEAEAVAGRVVTMVDLIKLL